MDERPARFEDEILVPSPWFPLPSQSQSQTPLPEPFSYTPSPAFGASSSASTLSVPSAPPVDVSPPSYAPLAATSSATTSDGPPAVSPSLASSIDSPALAEVERALAPDPDLEPGQEDEDVTMGAASQPDEVVIDAVLPASQF